MQPISPVKRHQSTHNRNRHSLKRLHKVSNINSTGKSLFDDLGDDNDDIFSFNKSSLRLQKPEERSFLSLEPFKEDLFDFNSYLKHVTSEIKIDPSKTPDLGFIVKETKDTLLNIDKGTKLDLINDRETIIIDNLLDEWELDCVVRASKYDPDSELKEQENQDEDFGVDFFKLAESQEQKAQNIFKLNNDIFQNDKDESKLLKDTIIQPSVRTPIKFPTTKFSFDPTLSLTNDKESFLIFNDKLEAPEPQSLAKRNSISLLIDQPSTPTKIQKSREFCSPHHHILKSPIKSNFKPIPKTLLNLIVESSDGNVEDAVKFATEINSQNCLGIPLPEKTTELVNIPTNGPPDQSGHRKSAIIRGIRAKSGRRKKLHLVSNIDKEDVNMKKFNHYFSQRKILKDTTNDDNRPVNGFYNAIEKNDHFEKKQPSSSSTATIPVGNKLMMEKKGVSWAHDLEW